MVRAFFEVSPKLRSDGCEFLRLRRLFFHLMSTYNLQKIPENQNPYDFHNLSKKRLWKKLVIFEIKNSFIVLI